MTLAGHNFAGLQGESTVSFVNGSGSATVVSTVDSWSDAQVKVQLPTGFTTGTVLVTVAGRDSNSLLYPAGTQSGSTPSITCVSPDQAASGTTVTVTGKGFGLDPGVGKRSSTTDKISFGNVTALSEANITSWNDTQVVFVVPSTAVNGPLTITRSGAIENIQVDRPSGFAAHELAAQRALLLSRLPELPAQYPNATLGVGMWFEYSR